MKWNTLNFNNVYVNGQTPLSVKNDVFELSDRRYSNNNNNIYNDVDVTHQRHFILRAMALKRRKNSFHNSVI